MSRFEELMAQYGQYHLVKNKLKHKKLWHVTDEKETSENHLDENRPKDEENQSEKFL